MLGAKLICDVRWATSWCDSRCSHPSGGGRHGQGPRASLDAVLLDFVVDLLTAASCKAPRADPSHVHGPVPVCTARHRCVECVALLHAGWLSRPTTSIWPLPNFCRRPDLRRWVRHTAPRTIWRRCARSTCRHMWTAAARVGRVAVVVLARVLLELAGQLNLLLCASRRRRRRPTTTRLGAPTRWTSGSNASRPTTKPTPRRSEACATSACVGHSPFRDRTATAVGQAL